MFAIDRFNWALQVWPARFFNHRVFIQMRNPLNILILGNLAPYRIGGAEVQARLLAERFARRGHRVTVAGYGNPRGRIAVGGVQDRTVETVRLRTIRRYRMIRAISYAASLVFFLLSNKRRFDVVLCYMLGESDLVLALLKQFKLRDLPLVVCSAGFGPGGDADRLNSLLFSSTFIALLNRQCNAVNIISPHIEAELSASGVVGHFTHIPNGVALHPPLSLYASGKTRVRSFLFAGRLVRLKGCADLLDAARQLNGAGIPFKVNIVGAGPQLGALRDLARAYGIDARVTFHGAVHPGRMAHHYRENTILVLPSRREAQGMVVAEAMSFGLPVIVTRSGGPEYTVDERMARIIPRRNSKALAAAMEEMLRMPGDQLKAMGATARQHAGEHFDIEKVADQFIDLFYQLKAGPGG